MSSPHVIPLRLISRTSSVCDWECPRKRFYGYEWGGIGLSKASTSLALATGISIHDSLATIATMYNEGLAVDIDTIANTAYRQMYEALIDGQGEYPSEDSDTFAKEQATLTEGLLRGFYKHVWPRLIAIYPRVIAIEKEVEHKFDNEGQYVFMAKPDLILEDYSGDWHYLEYKSTSSKKEEWVNSWDTAVQLHSSIKAVEETMGKAPVDVTIIGLYKGYYCLVPDTPVLTSDLRWVSAGTLKPGEKLAAFDEYPGKTTTGRVAKRRWKESIVQQVGRAILPSYKLTFEDGSIVTCSSHHKWLVPTRTENGTGNAVWKTTEELEVRERPNKKWRGDRVIKVVEPWEGSGEFSEYDAGYLAAAFDGEGTLVQTTTKTGFHQTWLHFFQNPGLVLDKVCSLFRKYGIEYSNLKCSGKYKTRNIQISDRKFSISILGKVRPVRLLDKFTPELLGGLEKCKPAVGLVKKEFVGDQEVVTLGTSTKTLVANGFASHNSYNRQNSPMCYAYMKKGNPPFTTDQISHEYKSGFKRYPTWELEGGVKAWVESMSDETLANQFPMTPPIMINDDLVERFFAQRLAREQEIVQGLEKLALGEDEEKVMDKYFPQRFDKCQPAWGYPCEFKKLCHAGVRDPLSEGFIKRVPHHDREAEALGVK